MAELSVYPMVNLWAAATHDALPIQKPLRLCGRRLRQRNVRIRRSYSVNSGNSGRRLDTQASAVKAGCLQVDSEINAEVPVAGRRRKIVAIYGQ